MSKDKGINLLRNADFNEKLKHYKAQKLLAHIKMDKEIITSIKVLYFQKKWTLITFQYLTRLFLLKKTKNTLLVNCMMIIKLSHCR